MISNCIATAVWAATSVFAAPAGASLPWVHIAPQSQIDPSGANAAASSPRVFAPSIVFEGDVSAVARERIETAWRAGLLGAGVAAADAVGSAACADESCLAQAGAESDSAFAVGLHIVVTERDYALTVVFIDNDNNATRIEEQCSLCGFDEVGQTAKDLAVRLRPKLNAARNARLTVHTQPPGATVVVDGELAGTTPYTADLASGEHIVRLELDGYFPRETTVELAANTRDARSFELAVIPPAPRPREGRGLRIAGWSGIGTGAGLLLGGGVLWGFHHRDVRDRCAEALNIDREGDCRFRYNSFAPAIGLTVASSAILIAGATLVALGYKRKRTSLDHAWRRRSPTWTMNGLKVKF